MARIRFGTSGWRGIIADDFTFDGVRAVAFAIAEYVRDEGGRDLVIGYDTRFASSAVAALVTRVLAAHGIKALLPDRDTPTPVVAHEILRRGVGGGVTVTASHNPPEYNGIKFSIRSGGPAPLEVTERIERRANEILSAASTGLVTGPSVPEMPLEAAEAAGLLERIDPRPAYLDRLRHLVDLEAIQKAGFRVIVDPLYGTAQGYLDTLLEEAGCEVIVLHSGHNPSFGGHPPDPAEEHLGDLIREVKEKGADLGLACDGDGDRFGIVDRGGAFMEPNYILGLLLRHLLETRGKVGGVARSVATSHLVDAVAHRYGVPVYETPVGFKYIGPLIVQGKVILGGEESAGLSIRGHVPEKDGILACLLVAEMVAARRKSITALLQELYQEVGTFLTKRLDLRLGLKEQEKLMAWLSDPPGRLADLKVVEVKRLEGTKLLLKDGSWVLLRPSGTEPVVRLYVEAPSEETLQALIEAAKRILRS